MDEEVVVLLYNGSLLGEKAKEMLLQAGFTVKVLDSSSPQAQQTLRQTQPHIGESGG